MVGNRVPQRRNTIKRSDRTASVGLVLTSSCVRRCLRMGQMSQPNAPAATRHARTISAIMRPPVNQARRPEPLRWWRRQMCGGQSHPLPPGRAVRAFSGESHVPRISVCHGPRPSAAPGASQNGSHAGNRAWANIRNQPLRSPLTESNRRPSPYHGNAAARRPASLQVKRPACLGQHRSWSRFRVRTAV
jgi:hypothetical protein